MELGLGGPVPRKATIQASAAMAAAAASPSMAASLKRISEDVKGKGKMRAASASLSARFAAGMGQEKDAWTGKALEVWVPQIGGDGEQGRAFYVLTKGCETGVWSVSLALSSFLSSFSV